MKVRRGLLLAGIHVAVAAGLLLSLEVNTLRSEKQPQALNLIPAAYQEEGGTVTFSACDLWYHIRWQGRVLALSEFPAFFLSGYGEICPARWTVAGVLGIGPRSHSARQQAYSVAGLLALIAIQWILIGSFPLAHPRRWWEEPGALNTLCTVVTVPLIAIGLVLQSTALPGREYVLIGMGLLTAPLMLVVGLTWPLLLALFVWRLARGGWDVIRLRGRTA
jgi:hypothetical protein